MTKSESLPQWLRDYQRAYPEKSPLQEKIESNTNITEQIAELRAEIEQLRKQIAELSKKRDLR